MADNQGEALSKYSAAKLMRYIRAYSKTARSFKMEILSVKSTRQKSTLLGGAPERDARQQNLRQRAA
jgi:hypothetical protein